MRWLSRRTRIFLFAVMAFLLLTGIVIGVIRIVNPELNLTGIIGFAEYEKSTFFRTRPYWKQLTNEQREVLAPLENGWDRIAPSRKEKWLEVAQRMENLSPEERKRLQERIQVWVSLTPEQRKDARENYLSAQKLDIKDKSLQWLEYQNLPEEEKKELAAKARKKRRIVNSKLGKKKPAAKSGSAGRAMLPAKEEVPDYWR